MIKKFFASLVIIILVFSPLSLDTRNNEILVRENGAHALFGIADFTITFSPTEFARSLWEWVQTELYRAAIEKLKQTLLSQLTKGQLDFIKSGEGGASRIIESWPKELQDAFNIAFDRFINEVGLADTLCTNIKTPLLVTLNKIRMNQNTPFGSRQYCTLNYVFGNINNFTNTTARGGFINYGTLIEENPFEQMRLTIQEVIDQGGSEAETKKNEAITGAGVKPTTKCNTWFPPGPLGPPPGVDESTPGWEQYCLYKTITTPGIITKDQAETAIGSQTHYTVNITSVLTLVAQSFLKSLINKVVTNGVDGLLGIDAGSTSGTYNPADFCKNLTGDALLACYAATDNYQALQAYAANKIPQLTTTTNQLISVLQSLLSCEGTACADAAAAGQVSPYCSTQTPQLLSQAKAYLQLLQEITANIRNSTDAEYINSQLSYLQTFNSQNALSSAQGSLAQCQNAPPPALPPPPPDCGNGLIETGEQCDGGNLNGQTCVNLGFAGGSVSCNSACQFNTTACTGIAPPPVCGNGIIESGEDCEGANLNGWTCPALGFAGGSLACNSACQFTTNACSGVYTPPTTPPPTTPPPTTPPPPSGVACTITYFPDDSATGGWVYPQWQSDAQTLTLTGGPFYNSAVTAPNGNTAMQIYANTTLTLSGNGGGCTDSAFYYYNNGL